MSTDPRDSRNNPAIWVAASRRLLNTLNVIERGLASSDDTEGCDAELCAMMIAGFAFENAFKARFLAKGGTLFTKRKQLHFRGHDFSAWIADDPIQMSEWQREVLRKAEFFCVAWGRYPSHSKIEKESRSETWGWSDVEQLKSLCEQLLAEMEKQEPNQPVETMPVTRPEMRGPR